MIVELISEVNQAIISPLTVAALDGTYYGMDSTGAGLFSRVHCIFNNDNQIPVPTAEELKQGTEGIAYSETISAEGGNSPYVFTITDGALPTGLSMDTDGNITGTPSAADTYTFTVTVTDTASISGSRSFSIEILSPSSGGGESFYAFFS